MKEKYADYYELEFAIDSKSSGQKSSTLASKLGRILHRLIESIIAVNELKIYSLKSRSGSAYWAINDPIAERRVFFESEQHLTFDFGWFAKLDCNNTPALDALFGLLYVA